jgi:hypothetical protein
MVGLGDQPGLAATFVVEVGLPGIGHPDLNRPQPCATHGVSMLLHAGIDVGHETTLGRYMQQDGF